MGNEHFWQVPRAKGVYARSITKHARGARKQSGRYQRTTNLALPTRGTALAESPKSAIFTRYV